MKKNYILGIAAIAAVSFTAMQLSDNAKIEKYLATKNHQAFGSGAPEGKTGAPGESTCVDCHTGGSAQDGTNINSISLFDGTTPVSDYVPGTTYNVVADINTTTNAGKGFSATVLDGSDNKIGVFANPGNPGTSVFTGTTLVRDYATHTTNALSSLWGWTWTAPATNVGPVTFYLSTNVSNGNAVAGDAIYISQHVFGSTADLDELNSNNHNFMAGYSVDGNKIVVDFSSNKVDNMYLNLVDLSGKSVFTYTLGESINGENHEVISLPEDINNGMYVVNFFVGNNPMSSKIMVQK